jgi:hypothetical protein
MSAMLRAIVGLILPNKREPLPTPSPFNKPK